MSLQDTVMLALRHNLDVQIERLNPQISYYALNGYYGGYEPNLFMAGQHDHNEAGSRLLAGGFSIPGSVSDDNTFSSSLSGLSPFGTTYSLQGNATDSYGHNSSVNSNGIVSSSGFENTSGAASIKVTQPLLKNFLIDNTRLNIKVGKNRVKYSELALRQRIMNTIASTEQAYYDLIYDRELVEVQRKAFELANRLVTENRKREQVGSLAPLDVQQAEAQAAATEADLLSAENNQQVQQHLLKSLIMDNYSEWSDVTIVPTESLEAPKQIFDLHDSWSKGLTLRPDLLQAKLDLERAGFQLKYAKNQLLPELDVFGTYGFNGSGREFSGALNDIAMTDRPFYTYGGQISFPLGNRAARNTYYSGKAAEKQAILLVKRAEQAAMILIDDDIKQAQSNYERVAATRKAREFAEAALNAEEKKLQSGKSTTYTVLQMQRDLTTARGNEMQALAAYNKSLSQLSLHEGTILERRGVNLDVK